MPFSRSRSIESITRSFISARAWNCPPCRSMASTSVVLPWSTCATIATLRRSVRVCMVPLSPVLVVVAVPGSTAGTAFGLGSNVRPNARPIAAGAAAGLVLAMLHAGAAPAASVVDEIHYSYGDTGDSVVVDWRGAERTLSFGPTMAYGFVAVANPPAVTPVDSAGPFREIRLHGLAPDTMYHYRIGAGPDHVLQTAPLGSFRW